MSVLGSILSDDGTVTQIVSSCWLWAWPVEAAGMGAELFLVVRCAILPSELLMQRVPSARDGRGGASKSGEH